MDYNNQNGSYVIQEQGDLGLGLTDIDEAVIEREKKNKEKSEQDSKSRR